MWPQPCKFATNLYELSVVTACVYLQEFGIGFLLHFIFAAIYLLVWGMDM